MSPRCPHELSPSALAPEGVVPRLTVYAGSGNAPVQTHGWNLVWRGRERLEQRLMGQLHVWGRLMVFPINTGAQNRSALGGGGTSTRIHSARFVRAEPNAAASPTRVHNHGLPTCEGLGLQGKRLWESPAPRQ